MRDDVAVLVYPLALEFAALVRPDAD